MMQKTTDEKRQAGDRADPAKVPYRLIGQADERTRLIDRQVDLKKPSDKVLTHHLDELR